MRNQEKHEVVSGESALAPVQPVNSSSSFLPPPKPLHSEVPPPSSLLPPPKALPDPPAWIRHPLWAPTAPWAPPSWPDHSGDRSVSPGDCEPSRDRTGLPEQAVPSAQSRHLWGQSLMTPPPTVPDMTNSCGAPYHALSAVFCSFNSFIGL